MLPHILIQQDLSGNRYINKKRVKICIDVVIKDCEGIWWWPKTWVFFNITGLSNGQKGSWAFHALRNCRLPKNKAPRVDGDKMAVSEKACGQHTAQPCLRGRGNTSPPLMQAKETQLPGSNFLLYILNSIY